MDHDEFIGQVQQRARLGSRGAAQLPRELGEHLRRVSPARAGTGEQFSLDEFFERVTEREGIDQPEAEFHSRVVLEITDEATTGSLMTKVREQFPSEFDRLFEAGSTGRMRRDA